MSPTIPVVTIPAAAIPVAAIPVPATPVPATSTAPPPPVEPRSPIPELPFSFRLPPSYQNSHNLRPSPQTGPPARSLLLVRSSFQRRIQKEYQLTVRHPQGQPAWDDHDLFRGLRTAYNRKLRTVWERYLSLKGLKLIRLLEYTCSTLPVEVEMEPFAHQQLMRAFRNPRALHGKQDWITWVFNLKARTDAKYALEFVSGWDGWRVLVAGAVPWIASCLTAVLWSVGGGNVQTGLAVASFMLAASGGVVAMLAVLSTLEK